jgi:8-oxo-dGTP pyrophosphatase MutT (NUDIX family)
MKTRSDMVTVFVARPDSRGESHEFLQLHRAPQDYMGNTWQIVRGTVEPGETAVQGALRELREEAGLAPNEFYRLGSVESFYIPNDDTLWHSVSFLALVTREANVVLNEEHDDARWIPRSEILDETMWPSERWLLRDLCQDILDNGSAKPHLRIDLTLPHG